MVFLHTFRKDVAAQVATAVFVEAPSAATEITANDHLNWETLAEDTGGNHRIWGSEFPVRADVAGSVQELSGNLVEDLTFARDALWKDNIECGDAVGCHHHQHVVINIINVTYFSVINAFLFWKIKFGMCNSCHIVDFFNGRKDTKTHDTIANPTPSENRFLSTAF